jgi:hypothetical protein
VSVEEMMEPVVRAAVIHSVALIAIRLRDRRAF